MGVLFSEHSVHSIHVTMTNGGAGCEKSHMGPIVARRLVTKRKANKHTCATVHKCKYVSDVQEIVLTLKSQQRNNLKIYFHYSSVGAINRLRSSFIRCMKTYFCYARGYCYAV